MWLTMVDLGYCIKGDKVKFIFNGHAISKVCLLVISMGGMKMNLMDNVL
jgi:hypothetical protein